MAFAVTVKQLCEELRLKPIAWNTAGQLLDASTSMAANYRATSRSRSKAEWNAKIGVVAEEADEAVHWLEFVAASKMSPKERVEPLLGEAKELRAIFAASAGTSRRNSRRRPRDEDQKINRQIPRLSVQQISHPITRSRVQQMDSLQITWLGHSSFRLRTPGGKELLFDPWYTGNPAFPESARPTSADLILVSHGHSDHIADAAAMAKSTGATVVGIWEVTSWLGSKGVQNLEPMNKGGTITTKGLRITMTDARHSSSFDDKGIVYLGEAAGFVVTLENSQVLYYAGDTSLFGDMRLIGELYSPDIAFLPIGDRFTMGPDAAAVAARWLAVKQVVPMHHGTFPLLTGTPRQLEEHLTGSGIEVLTLTPGETAK